MEIQLHLIDLHPAQQTIVEHPARFKVVACGRRFGKTELCQDVLINDMLDGYPVAYFAPTYKMQAEVWRAMKKTLAPLNPYKNEVERRIEIMTGGSVDFWSLDSADSVRGRKYKRLVIDEAALIPSGDVWNDVLRPLLTDYRGGALFLSTPRGLNWFYNLFQLGLDDDGEWKSWNFPTSANPFIALEEIEAARRTMPERSFAQEYLATFSNDAGGVFRRVREAARVEPQDRRREGGRYIFGVDLAKTNDYTVIAVVDVDRRECVYIDRFNQIDYTLQLGRLQALRERFDPDTIVIETNVGQMFIELAQRAGLPVQPFTTTNPSKQTLIDNLALAFERGDIGIINHDVLIHELQAYEMERLPSGLLRYSAPAGMHDDTVIALALAWHGVIMPTAPPSAVRISNNSGLYRSRDERDKRRMTRR